MCFHIQAFVVAATKREKKCPATSYDRASDWGTASCGHRRWKYPARWPNHLFIPTQPAGKQRRQTFLRASPSRRQRRVSRRCPEAAPPAVCGSAPFPGISLFPAGRQQRGPSARGEAMRAARGCPDPREPRDPLARRPPRRPGTAQDANRISKRCPWVKGCAGTFLPSEVACLSSAKMKLGWATQGTRYWEQLSFSGSPLHPLSLQQASWEKPFPITPSHLQEYLVVPPRFARHSWVVHIVGIGRPQRESKRNAVRFNCFLFI